MEEQGCWTECVYCTEIKPDIGDDCPFCNGKKTFFKPAQMMDEVTSRAFIFNEILQLYNNYTELDDSQADKKKIERYISSLVSLMQYIKIYDFNIKEAIKEHIYKLEQIE